MSDAKDSLPEGEFGPLELMAATEAKLAAQHEKELAAATKASDERSQWDYGFFDLAFNLQTLAKHDSSDRIKSAIADYCYGIAALIESDNSIPGVLEFNKLHQVYLKKHQNGGGSGQANLPGIVAILELIDRAIRKDNRRLNIGIDAIKIIIGRYPYAPFDAQQSIYLRTNPKLQDFESVVTGRLTREDLQRERQFEFNPLRLADDLEELARSIDAHGLDSSVVSMRANSARIALVQAHNRLLKNDPILSKELGEFSQQALQIQRGRDRTQPVPDSVSHSLRLFAIRLKRIGHPQVQQLASVSRDSESIQMKTERENAGRLSIRLERCLQVIESHSSCDKTNAETDAELMKILDSIRDICNRFNDQKIHQFVVSSVIETPATEFIAEITARLDIAGKVLNGFEIPELTRLTVLSKTLKHAVEQPYSPTAKTNSADESAEVPKNRKRSAGKKAPKPKRGRPPTRNLKADRELVKNWNSAQSNGTDRQRFCDGKGISVKDLEAAQRKVSRG